MYAYIRTCIHTVLLGAVKNYSVGVQSLIAGSSLFYFLFVKRPYGEQNGTATYATWATSQSTSELITQPASPSLEPKGIAVTWGY